MGGVSKSIPVLRKRSQFLEVANKGGVIFSRSVILQFHGRDDGCNTYGFTITKKIGKAVVRNFIKRRMRSVVREADSKNSGSFSYVFIAKRGAAKCSFADMRQDMLYCFRKSIG